MWALKDAFARKFNFEFVLNLQNAILNNKTNLLSVSFIILQIGICVIMIIGRQCVPLRWDVHGCVDEYGRAYYALLLPFVSICVYLLMTFFEKHPNYCNWPRKFYDEQVGYCLVGGLVGKLKLLTMLFLTFIVYKVYIGGDFSYIVASLFLVAAFIVVYVYGKKLSKA